MNRESEAEEGKAKAIDTEEEKKQREETINNRQF